MSLASSILSGLLFASALVLFLLGVRKGGLKAELNRQLLQDFQAKEYFAALLLCLGKVPAREEELGLYARRAERLFPMHALPHYTAAVYARRHDDCEAALAALNKAVRWGFNKGYLESECYGLMAECLHQEGRDEEALRCARHAVNVNPKNAAAQLEGAVSRRTGKVYDELLGLLAWFQAAVD